MLEAESFLHRRFAHDAGYLLRERLRRVRGSGDLIRGLAGALADLVFFSFFLLSFFSSFFLLRGGGVGFWFLTSFVYISVCLHSRTRTRVHWKAANSYEKDRGHYILRICCRKDKVKLRMLYLIPPSRRISPRVRQRRVKCLSQVKPQVARGYGTQRGNQGSIDSSAVKWAWWRQRFDIKWMAHDGLDSLSETAWAIPCSSVCGCSPFPDDALVQLKQNGLAWCCQCLSHAAGKSYISHFFVFVSLGLIRGRLSRRLTWKELLKVLSTRQDPDSCASHRSALSALCILVRSFWGDGAGKGRR